MKEKKLSDEVKNDVDSLGKSNCGILKLFWLESFKKVAPKLNWVGFIE